MDTLQEQIGILSHQVEELSQRIEQLSAGLSEVASECRFGSDQIQRLEGRSPGYRSNTSHTGFNTLLDHKDVLPDGGELESQTGDRHLTPEIQIQRLTAQLTAAYNRIAALEEQLLSKKRVRS